MIFEEKNIIFEAIEDVFGQKTNVLVNLNFSAFSIILL